MKIKFRWLVCWLILCVAGCSSTPKSQNPLIGKWQEVNRNFKTMELLADGTYKSSTVSPTNNFTTTRVGTYEIIDDTDLIWKVKLRDTDTEPREIRVKYQISGDNLVVTPPNGISIKFERVH